MTDEIRKLIDIPAKSRVEVCILLPYEAILMMTNTVMIAAEKLLIPIPRTKPSAPRTIAVAAPREAPELTPKI